MAKENRWFLPTNTDNLRMIIAQGLMTNPKGFSKYYTDTLEIFNGYIPLFKNKIQQNILKYVCSETEGLTPCILEFNVNVISGSCKAISRGELIDCNMKDIDEDNIDIVLIPAPLPISCISKVILQNIDIVKTFENDANLYSNVPIHDINITSASSDHKLFKEKIDMTSDYQIDTLKNLNIPSVIDLNYDKVYAYGGLLANLFYYAKNGKMSNDVFLECTKESKKESIEDYSLILNYFHATDSNVVEDNINQQLYKGLLDKAIHCKDFKEGIIDFLESDTRTITIANKLKTFESMSDKPISEEFEEATTLLGKTLLMLFIREDSDALMDYHLELFSEKDYLNFAMIFGIRDKFIKVPKFVKEFENLQNFVSTKMAIYAHKQLKSDINIDIKRKNVMTLFEMLKKNSFKIWFAKTLEIEACFKSKLKIPNGNYELKGTSTGFQIIFDGIVAVPTAEIIEDKYFKFISKSKMLDYNKYLMNYKKI